MTTTLARKVEHLAAQEDEAARPLRRLDFALGARCGMTWDGWDRNSYGCWELAIACMREQSKADRPLTPREMLELVDNTEREHEER